MKKVIDGLAIFSYLFRRSMKRKATRDKDDGAVKLSISLTKELYDHASEQVKAFEGNMSLYIRSLMRREIDGRLSLKRQAT